MEDKFAQDKIKEKEIAYIKEHSENTEKEVCQCKICKKKFKAFNFIITHIKNKHSGSPVIIKRNSGTLSCLIISISLSICKRKQIQS